LCSKNYIKIHILISNISIRTRRVFMKKIVFIVCMIFAYVFLYSEPIVTLSVTERAGFSRVSEPVLMGVPLPDGLLSDTGELALKDASGNVVNCHFAPAQKWWTDKQSLRWVHLNFQTDMDSGAVKQFTLWREPASHRFSGSNLSLSDLGTKYQITTGPVRFTVKKKGFNLFDEAWIDESGAMGFTNTNKVIDTHKKGFSLLSSGGVRYYGVNDSAATSTVVVEQNNPAVIVLKADGKMKSAAGSSLFDYSCRIFAYANSKIVRVVFTFENRSPTASSFVSMYGLNLELPLSLSSVNYGFGHKRGTKTGTLSGSDAAYLYVHAIDKYRFGLNNSVIDSGNTRTDRSFDLGTVWASDGSKGVGALTQFFWQMYPSSVEINGSGNLNLGLFSHRLRSGPTSFPPRFADHYDIAAGMARTHDIRIVFFNDDTEKEVRASLSGSQSPLYALAPAAWYCRATKALGPLVEKGNWSLFTSAESSVVAPVETKIWTNALRCVGNTNGLIGGKEAYDYLGWGDNPHGYKAVGDLYWNGNYYDLPILIYTHFVRTLDYRFLDYAYAHTAHIRDLHQTHFEPTSGSDGACRYCPPTNHYGNETLVPAVMTQTSHHKTQSMFFQYYMLADYRARDVALKGVKWIKNKGTSENAEFACYTRRPANCINTLVEGYKYNYDAGCLTVLNNFITSISNIMGTRGVPACGLTDQFWMVGLLGEAMVDAYEATRNTEWMRLAKLASDSIPPSSASSNMAYTAAASWRFYNSPQNRVRALGNFSKVPTDVTHLEKDYTLDCRSIPKAIGMFAIPDSLNGTSAAEAGSGARLDDIALSITPNPFNPSTLLLLSGILTKHEIVSIAVFSSTGKKIWSIEGMTANGSFVAEWNGKDADNVPVSSGYYLARAVAGSRIVEKKMVLIR
jgi:hypothetical protein